MAIATVYIISFDKHEVVEQFDCDYNLAIGEYHNKRTSKGTYYIARKGSNIPFSFKKKILQNVYPRHQEDQERSSEFP